MSQDGCVEPTDRRYGDPLDDELPGTATDPPVTLIGYWEGDTEPGWPRMADVVDEHRDETERHLVASYLEEGFRPWAQGHILVPGVREGERFGRAHRWRLPMAKKALPTTSASMASAPR